MNILVGGAWPYANGSLHVGHLAALLPADVIARYHRKKGDDVLYVSGSDCHGTPISVRAKTEGVEPQTITDKYHKEFKECFEQLGFSYDLYTRTDDDYHKTEVQKIVTQLYDNGYIYEKEVEQVYCEHCNQFLPDRFVEGTCPVCGKSARGDQCDSCQSLLDPIELLDKKCKICGSTPTVRPAKQLYFALSKFEAPLREYVEHYKDNWRINAVNTAKRYIDEGLQDRAITRDLPWGIDVPIDGYQDKKIYVWIDAVLGYLTASKKWAEANNKDYTEFWNETAVSYYVHGKDNIPFHNVILPALLTGINLKGLPTKMISSEYVTIEGKKISTSNNWAVWASELIEHYHPDVIRYFFLANGPEKRDADFSYRELVTVNNADLVGAYGNLVNRTLAFIVKSYNSEIKPSEIDVALHAQINQLYTEVGSLIEKGEFKQALKAIFELVRFTNKYFDENKPWLTIKEDKEVCYHTLYNCVYAIINIANLLEPFLPFSYEKVKEMLCVNERGWKPIDVPNTTIKTLSILFERLDKVE
jgi:methionyl-tRNA synthetase